MTPKGDSIFFYSGFVFWRHPEAQGQQAKQLMKLTTLKPILLTAFLSSNFLQAEEVIIDDFSNDLSNWTSTVILDAGGTGSNAFAWEIVDEVLKLTTSVYDGIEQSAFTYDGLALAVGEEVQVELSNFEPPGGNDSLGLYVGGTAPTTGVREDYITVYAKNNGIFCRGFDGTVEYDNPRRITTDYDKLFIARIEENTYQAGFYNGEDREVVTTRSPVVPNSGNYVGIYSDVRALSTLGDLDNFCIAAAPNGYEFSISEATFATGEATGFLVGILTATVFEAFEDSTFSLVSGEGDTDNSLFQIGGTHSDELLTNADFTAAGEDPVDGQTYSIRVEATDVATGNLTTEMILTITVSKDDDLDGLNDEWELRWKGVLTSLSVGNDADGDGIFDDEEYAIFQGSFLDLPAYDINPGSSDTDNDGLTDEEELFEFVGDRNQTDPTNPDSDFDGLTDFNETGSGAVETLPLVGTSGNNLDSDGDGAKDGYELAQGSDPLLDSSVPPSVSASVSVTQITDDASSGISDSKVYTHAISGGYATTVNGVDFDVLNTTEAPANFEWTAPSGKNQIAAANLGSWLPSSGGVTGSEVIDLLSGFTYSNGIAPPGGAQTFTLSGLAPGSTYELRIYTRAWSPLDDSGRLIDLTFINGSEEVQPWNSLAFDRPSKVLGFGNDDEAYFISYSYTAEGSDLVVEAPMPLGANAGTGGFDTLHLYGLTNELVEAGPVGPEIVDIFFEGADLKIKFSPGGPGFILTSSDDLTSSADFTEEVNATYDNVDTFTVPASALDTDGNDFFRIESL
ncbi:hypothetical protein GCM10007100_13340 [Roseibacillus persicicus]|uniref:Uncharacterized protein n=2 Tax=Roseibacillus persicicus TaxID=454148 RepID=A0A918WI87_9BACT|nr:hypothetical protein GCM10007100_13340 [Roseibacillus persicicus]